MQNLRNCQRRAWVLSGTEDGPRIVQLLTLFGWAVTVSVVSKEASRAYADLQLESLLVGPLQGIKGITDVLDKQGPLHKGFDLVIDATHPFATLISLNLYKACKTTGKNLLRFERHCEISPKTVLISSFSELSSLNLANRNILLAIGSRHLYQAVKAIELAGGFTFARILPSANSVLNSLAAPIYNDHLAIVRPDKKNNYLEEALCRKWNIEGIVCRESGGSTQILWQSICEKNNLDLWMIARPKNLEKVKSVNSIESLADLLKGI